MVLTFDLTFRNISNNILYLKFVIFDLFSLKNKKKVSISIIPTLKTWTYKFLTN